MSSCFHNKWFPGRAVSPALFVIHECFTGGIYSLIDCICKSQMNRIEKDESRESLLCSPRLTACCSNRGN